LIALNLASILSGVTHLALVTVTSTTLLMARPLLNILKDERFDTFCEKLKVACLLATSHVSWPRLNLARMFLNAQRIASSALGVLGSVHALLASILVSLSLFKFVNDPSLKWGTEFVAVHGKSEFVIFLGAAKTALSGTGPSGDLASQPEVASREHKVV
jgi:hypothetical protein